MPFCSTYFLRANGPVRLPAVGMENPLSGMEYCAGIDHASNLSSACLQWYDDDSHFQSSNSTLDAVWELSRYTLDAASLDTYTDSNTRERRPCKIKQNTNNLACGQACILDVFCVQMKRTELLQQQVDYWCNEMCYGAGTRMHGYVTLIA